MVLELIVHKTNDGYTAEVPSLSGVDSWAHKEDDVIENAIELIRYYASVPDENEIKIDRARKLKNKIIYKVIFDK